MVNIITALPCGCYILAKIDSISMLPISDYAWTKQQFMQLVSIFAYVYFKDITAPLESVCHAWYIKENEINQARQKGKKEKKKDKYSHSMQRIYTANN